MAARHFVAGAFEQLAVEEPGETPAPQSAQPRRGRHFKVPAIDEVAPPQPTSTAVPEMPLPTVETPLPADTPDASLLPEIEATPRESAIPTIEDELVAQEVPAVPSIPVSTFAVPVSQNQDADALARARIEEILRELETPPAPEPVPEPVPTVGPDPLEAIDADSQMDEHPLGFDELDATSDLGASQEEGELETTAVIDYDAVRVAVGEQESLHDEPVAPIQRRERLEVGSGFYVPPNNSKSSTDSWLAEHKPHLSFFAAIGEFFARLFHMDD